MAATPIPSCPNPKCGASDSWKMYENYSSGDQWYYSMREDGRWEKTGEHIDFEDRTVDCEDPGDLEDTTVTCGACETDLEDHSKLWTAMTSPSRDFYWPDLNR